MVLDIDTENKKYGGKKINNKVFFSKLTTTLYLIILLPIVIALIGFLYLDQYKNTLISQELSGLRRQAAAFNLVASNARITSQQFADGVTAQLKAEEKLRTAQLERIRIQERLYTTDFTQGGTKIDATGFKGVEGILGAEDQISNTKASLSAYKAELENINRFLTIGGDQYNRVEQAINRINGKLGLNLKNQKDTTTEQVF